MQGRLWRHPRAQSTRHPDVLKKKKVLQHGIASGLSPCDIVVFTKEILHVTRFLLKLLHIFNFASFGDMKNSTSNNPNTNVKTDALNLLVLIEFNSCGRADQRA